MASGAGQPEALPRQRAQGRLRRPPRAHRSRLVRQEGRDFETGAQLLQRILAERKRAWVGKREYVEPVPAAQDEAPLLPEGWEWAALDELAWHSSYGTSAKCSSTATGAAVLRIPNVDRGNIDTTDMKHSAETLDAESTTALKPGDMLIIRPFDAAVFRPWRAADVSHFENRESAPAAHQSPYHAHTVSHFKKQEMPKIANRQIALKPQDLFVVLALLSRAEPPASLYPDLAALTGLAVSAVHASLKRAAASRLVMFQERKPVVLKPALLEFLVHGARYAFPPVQGGLTRGVPTAYAAAPLNESIAPSADPPPVWPHAKGSVRGLALAPLYPSVPEAALKDAALYEALALLDALRIGQARERNSAHELLKARFK